MRTLFVLAALASASAYTPPTFEQWVEINNRAYEPSEYNYRMSIYNSNARRILRHNAANYSWTMEANKFADMTAYEFGEYVSSAYTPRLNFGRTRSPILSAAPASVDWTTKGAVTAVKDQGQCGSCWAFSATGSVEGAWFLSNGTLVSVSEQQLVDCSSAQGNQGCDGGLMDSAFSYIIANGGITSEANYPYTAQDGTCSATKSAQTVVNISKFVDVVVNSEVALENAISQQPVSVAVEADQDSFQLYAGGVMTAPCGTALDHGVLAVGYGTDSTSGNEFWKVKNSWGADWGMQGYILLGKGKTYNGGAGQCGILMDPSYPVV